MRTPPRCLIPFLAVCAAVCGAAPDPFVLPNSEVRDLPRIQGREYQVLVRLPSSYASNPEKRYPVLYLCDGYWDFSMVSGVVANLVYDKAVPEMVVVGLSYPGVNPRFDSLRQYDFTPIPLPHDPKGLVSGHAPEFLKSLRENILPFVESRYRIDTTWRVLGGSSLGGLFAFYAAFEAPNLFEGVIAPSPAVMYGNGWLLRREAAFHRSGVALPTRLFLSTADGEWPDFSAAIRRFHDSLSTHQLPESSLKWRVVEGERHAGTKPESFNRGLRFVFAPRAPEPSER